MTSILIESVNYNGQEVNVVFNPAGTELSINLGTQIIPFEFNPYLLVPSFDVYGTYSFLTLSGDCALVLNVPAPSPTPTPTVTPTRTMTPTPTLSPTPSPTFEPCQVTPTPTPTKSPLPDNPKIYWGKFSGNTITSGDTIGFSNGYTNDPTNSYRNIPSGSGYGYILIPISIPQPTDFRDSISGCTGFNIPFSSMGTIFINDANGVSINYNIYRTFYPFAGSVNVWMCS